MENKKQLTAWGTVCVMTHQCVLTPRFSVAAVVMFFSLSQGSVVTALWRLSSTVGSHRCLWMEDYMRLKIRLICSQTASTLVTKECVCVGGDRG